MGADKYDQNMYKTLKELIKPLKIETFSFKEGGRGEKRRRKISGMPMHKKPRVGAGEVAV